MAATSGKTQERGIRSRSSILDSAEHLMASRGYAGTSISAICKDTGLPPTSIYHHFGNKQQLLAQVMERGARRWFASLPDLEHGNISDFVIDGADAVAGNPLFLGLFYQLSLDSQTDEGAAHLVKDVRASAFRYFEDALTQLLVVDYPRVVAHAAAVRLTPFAVALSDGCFFSLQLESDPSAIRQMYADLLIAIRAMAPAIVENL